eukprot:Hpha_TRINITY_DN28997_c0_g1::TRINITY_DN28997_c0_g1_i1::g.19450::m.19450
MYKEQRYYSLQDKDLAEAFEKRTGQKLSPAAYLEEYKANPKRSGSALNRKGMDTSEDEPNCVRIDITEDEDAVLPRIREILGLPKVEGKIDATEAAEANWR